MNAGVFPFTVNLSIMRLVTHDKVYKEHTIAVF